MTRAQALAVAALVVAVIVVAALLYAAGRTAEAAVVGLGAGAAAVGRATGRRKNQRQAARVERREGEARTATVRKAEAQLARELAELDTPAKDKDAERARLRELAAEAAKRRSGR